VASTSREDATEYVHFWLTAISNGLNALNKNYRERFHTSSHVSTAARALAQNNEIQTIGPVR
jgi:hypothetical protein